MSIKQDLLRADDETPEIEEDLIDLQNKIRDINTKISQLPVNYVGRE